MNTYLLIGAIYGIIGLIISFTCIIVDITKAKIKKTSFDSGDLIGDLCIIPFWIIWVFLAWGESHYTIFDFRDKE